jgi:hypothetical protein
MLCFRLRRTGAELHPLIGCPALRHRAAVIPPRLKARTLAALCQNPGAAFPAGVARPGFGPSEPEARCARRERRGLGLDGAGHDPRWYRGDRPQYRQPAAPVSTQMTAGDLIRSNSGGTGDTLTLWRIAPVVICWWERAWCRSGCGRVWAVEPANHKTSVPQSRVTVVFSSRIDRSTVLRGLLLFRDGVQVPGIVSPLRRAAIPSRRSSPDTPLVRARPISSS